LSESIAGTGFIIIPLLTMLFFGRSNEDGKLPLEIDVATAAEQLDGEDAPLLLDVREIAERAVCKIKDGPHIPTGEVSHRWESLPKDKPLLVYCHHGMRSLRVTHFLRKAGLKNVQSLKGGIDAWSREIDPRVARY
jgi:adenylyltransferase/sulfurtransferase